jgi:hypothetical protein
MSIFTLSKLNTPSICQSCGIKSKDVFTLASDEGKRNLCSLCLSIEHPEKLKLETRTGLLVKRKSNRKIYSLLARALSHAAQSDDATYRNKADEIKKALLSTTDVVLHETGSDDGYDLLHLIKKHHQIVPMNFDEEFMNSIANSGDDLPDTAHWSAIYKNKRG